MLKKALYTSHRILGTVLCLLFLMWFLSGFVMLYHTFPKASDQDKYKNMEAMSGNFPTIDSIQKLIPQGVIYNKISLKTSLGTPYIEVVSKDSIYKFSLDSVLQPNLSPTYTQIEKQARKWNSSTIIKVDTLYNLEQWIPFGYLRKDFPIYKFYFNDTGKHQLYISSKTGNVLQFTNQDNRFWAWIGAIPHWIYFTSLRQNSTLWANVIISIAAFGCIVCVTGIVLGIRSYTVAYRKKKRWNSPYKKISYRWHHILGFIFGIFVFTFIFSGMMSLASVPNWLVKVSDEEIGNKIYDNQTIDLSEYSLDYKQILEENPNQVKEIEWSSFGSLPLYRIIINDKLEVIDASKTELRKLNLDEQTIRNRFSEISKDSITISKLTEYDNYYVGKESSYPLPVYKVDIANADHSTCYINPERGDVKYFNTNTKVRRWMYQILHTWKSGFLAKHPLLWNIVMWGTMIGGTLVSATGVWLGFRYLRRILKKKKKIYNKKRN